MPISIYNFFYTYNNRYLIFNSFSGTITEVDKELFDMLSKGELHDLESDQIIYLEEQGILTNKPKEFEEYFNHFEKTKFQPKLDIQFLISTACNLGCPYCYLESTVKNGGVVNPEKLNAFLSWIDYELSSGNYNSCNIELYGGEPLLAKQKIPGLIESLNKIALKTGINIDYSIVTNGTLLDDLIIQLLIENKTYIQITLDGLPETHNKRRFKKNQKGETFDIIWQNIKKVINLGGNDNLKVRMNIDRENWEEIEGLAKMCYEIGVKNFELSWVFFNSPEMPDYKNQYDTSYYDQRVVDLWKMMRPFGYATEVDNFMRLSTCMLYRKAGFVITDNLDVYKCDEMVFDKNHKVGEIDSDGRLIITNEIVFKNAIERNPKWFSVCVKCKLLPICGTGCPVKALKYNGDFDTYYCETTEENLRQRIINYVTVHDILENEE